MKAVKNIFSEVFGLPVDQILEDTTMENFRSWNSLNHLELMIAIEREFNIKFSMHELRSLRSVSHIVRALEERGH